MVNIVTNVGAWLIANATAEDKLTFTRSIALSEELSKDELAELNTETIASSGFIGEVTNISVERNGADSYVNVSAKFGNTQGAPLAANTIVILAKLNSSGAKDFPILGWSNNTPINIPGANDPSASVILRFKVGVQREQAANVEYTPANVPSYADLENYVDLDSEQIIVAPKTFEHGLRIGTRSIDTTDYLMPRIVGNAIDTTTNKYRVLSIASSYDEDECVEIELLDRELPTRRKVVRIQADELLVNDKPVAMKSDVVDNINHYPAYLSITYEYSGQSEGVVFNMGRGAAIHKGLHFGEFTITDVVGIGVDVGYFPEGAYNIFTLLTPITLRANQTTVTGDYVPLGVYVKTIYPQ